MPRKLHLSVNSERFTPSIDTGVVNDVLELWSLPWHALLRNLANGIGETAGFLPLIRPRPAVPARVSPMSAADAGSWLLRAHRNARPASSALP